MALFSKIAGKNKIKGQTALSSYETKTKDEEQTESTNLSGTYNTTAGYKTFKRLTDSVPQSTKTTNQYTNPFGIDILDKKYQQTALELYDVGKQYGSKNNPLEDAYNLTLSFAQTALKSYGLIGSKDKNPLVVADKSFDQLLQEKKWDYQYSNLSPKQYQQKLDELQYQPESAIKAQNQQNVLNLAKQKGLTGLTQEEEATARMYEEAARYGGNAGKLINATLGIGEVPLTPEGENEINPYRLDAKTRQKYAKAAEELRQKGQITYEDADKALESESYDFAKRHPGDLGEYANQFENVTAIANKAREKGVESLTDQEQEVYYLAMGHMDDLDDVSSGKLASWGANYANELRGLNGVFSAYKPTEEQSFVLGKYRETPEGAKQWVDEAAGTAEEEAAKRNYYFVSRKAKYDEIPTMGNWEEDSKAKEDFSSGDATLDRYYRIINNIGGARDQAEDYQSMSGGSDAALEFFYNTEEKDQATFNALMNRGQFDDARDYLDYMQYAVNAKIRERTETAMYNLGNAGGWKSAVAGIASIPMDMVRFLGAGDIYVQNIRNALVGDQGYRPVDVNTGWQLPGAASEAADKGILDKYDWKVHLFDRDYDVFDTLYSTVKSGVSSYAIGALSRGLGFGTKTAEAIASIWMGSNAAQGTMQDIAEAGGDNAQILIGGTLSGIFEGAFEKISIGELFKDLDKIGYRPIKERLKNIGKEALVNFSEEFNTEIANIVMEYFLMGDLSDQKKNYDEYIRLGMSEEEAQSMVWRDMVDRAMESGLSGALMGAGFGEIANINANVQTGKIDKATGAVVKPETSNILKTFGEQLGGDAAEVAKDYDPKKATNKQTGELVRTIFGQLNGVYSDTLLDRISVDLHDAGAGWDAAKSIARMMAGQELSPEEIQTLAKDQQAMRVMYEVFGGGEQQQERGKKNLPTLNKNQEMALDGDALANVGPLPGYGTDEDEQREKQGLPPLNKGISEEALDGVYVPPAQTETNEQREKEGLPPLNKGINEEALDGVYVPPAETETQEKQPKEGLPTLNKGINEEALDGVYVPPAQAETQEKQPKQNLPTMNKEAKPTALFENETAKAETAQAALEAEAPAEGEQKKASPHGRVVEVAFDGDSGTVEARMEDGSTVPLSESGLSEDQQSLAQEIADMPQDAQAAVTGLWNPGQSIKDLAQGFRRIFNAVAQGRDGDRIKSVYGEQLTEEQRQAAIEAGKAEYERTKAESQAKTKQVLENLKKRGFYFHNLNDGASKAGGVYFARVINRVSDAAAAQLSVIQKLANEYGVQVRVYDHMDENGSYESGSNVINLALDAEEGMLGRTVSHELFHFVREWSQEAGDKLRTYVLNALKNAQGYDYEGRVSQIMNQYKDETGKALEREDAEEEMAAEGMLDALDTDEALQDLFAETKDKTLIEKIKNWLSDMAKSIRAAIDSLAWNHPEVRALKDQADYMQGVSDRLKAALDQAAENYRASQRGLYADAAADPDVQAYTEAIKEKGITLEDARAEADYLANKLYLRAEKNWIEQHQDMYEAGFEKAKAAMMEYAQGKTSMVKAFTDQGLFAPPQELFPALAYAGRQMAAFQGMQNAKAETKANDQIKADQPVEVKGDLVAVHNVGENDLIKSLDLGGLPSPSVAVLPAQNGHSKFGEISLVFGKDSIDPQQGNNTIYGNDAFTQTVGEIDRSVAITDDAEEKAENKLAGLMEGADEWDIREAKSALRRKNDGKSPANVTDWASIAETDDNMIKAFLYSTGDQKSYPTDQDVERYRENTQEQKRYYEWFRNNFTEIAQDTVPVVYNDRGEQEEGIFGEERDRYEEVKRGDLTLDDIVQVMNQAPDKNAMAWDANGRALEQSSAKTYGSIEEAKQDSNRLKRSKEEYLAASQELEYDFHNALEALEEEEENSEETIETFGTPLAQIALFAASDYAKTGDINTIISRFEDLTGYRMTTETAQKFKALFDAAQNIPARYFEAKLRRAVPFSEVRLAVVPDTLSPELIQRMLDAGVQEVKTYPSKNEEARKEALNSKPDILFSRRATAQDTAYQNESFEYMKPFDEQVDDFMSEDREALLGRNSLLVSKAPEVFIEIGLPNLPVTIDQKHTGYALKGNYPDPKYRPGHTFTREEFKNLPQKIADPIAIGYDPKTTKQVIVYVDMKNTTGQQVIVPLRIGGVANIGNNRIQALKLLTSFADEDGLNMLKSAIQNDSNDHNTIFYLNKEKAAEVGTGDGMKTTVHFPSSGLIHRITDSGSPVKLEIQTQTDSKQFKQWFGNSQVKNEDKTPKVMYHGTTSDFWAFDLKKSNDKTGRLLGLGAGANKIYLTENEASAEMATRGAAARTKNEKERVLGLYVSAQKVMVREEYNRRLQEAYAKYPNSDPRGEIYDYKQRDKAIKAVDKQVKAEGYDGVWDKESGEMFAYDPTQVKSATENIGTFDRKNPDIRFSQRANTEDRQSEALMNDLRTDPEFYAQVMTDEETEEAVRLFAKIYRSLENLSNDLVGKITEREDWKYRKSELAKRLITETGSKMKQKDVADWIGRLFKALDKGGYNLGESLMYARALGMELIKKSPGMELPMDETTESILSALKNNKFYLTDDQKSEIRGTYGNLQTYLRTMFGKTNIVKKGADVSDLGTFWRETLTHLDPGTFAEDTQDLDMPGILAAWLETANQPKYSSEFGQNAGHYATSIGLELMGEYLDMPWTNQRVNALKGQYDKELKAIRQNYQGKYEARVEAASERRKKSEAKQKVINEIKKEVRKVRTRVMNASDSRHIPEELRGAAEAFLRIFDHDRAVFSGYEIEELANKYRLLAENGALHDTAAAAKYDQDIDAYLQGLAGIMKDGGQLRNLDQNTLEMVNNIVQHIAFVFSNQNEKEINGRQVNLEREANEFMAMMRAHREAKLDKTHQAARGLAYREMTPVYFAKRVGGIIKDVIDDMILNGQQKYAFHVRDTKKTMGELIKKYNVNKWINSKNHLQMDTVQGDHLELTKEQAMTIYAWWKREQSNTLQNAAHLKLGGFTYDLNDEDAKKYKGVNLHKSHVLSQVDINQIEEYLGKEGTGFVDAMVDYLSKTVSEWGNETSMALFGWKKYGENYYFPYPTDAQFRGKDLAFGSKGQNAKLKNISSSHALTENAHNPLKLGNFTDIWAEHVDQMAMYNAFAEKLDNLERVTNYVNDGTTTLDENGALKITPPESAKKLMGQAMGEEAVRYLEEFINDVNGGVRGDERGPGAKMFSLFKKGSVAANLSVMLQQPSAFVRAMSMVSAKYFVKGLNPKDLRKVKERMYANSGAAVIKDMGRFDTNMGKSSVEWMKDEINNPSKLGAAYDAMDKITGAGAEFADEITWCWMYSAIENEVEDTTNLTRGTEEFNKAVGQRFDAVMTQTQVYDSTLAKSQWMRSTGGLDKMFTSFMAEPTLWTNMLMDAAMDVAEKKPGAGKKAAIAAGVFISGSFVNALLKSLATALRRKDDEGRTWLEKYLAEVAGNFVEDVSPFGIASMVPIARDVVSLVQGFDVERADMTLVSELLNKVGKLVKKGDEATGEEWIDAGAAAANIFGIPFRNIYRDVKGLWGAFFGGANASGPSEGRDIWLSILDEVGDNLRIWSITPYDSANKAYYDRMEQALLSGDMNKYNELAGYLEETKGVKANTISTGVKNEIKDSFNKGLISDDKAMKLLQDQFGKDKEKAWEEVEKWRQNEAHADDEDYSYTKYGEVLDLVKEGKDITAAAKKLTDNAGVTDKDVRSAVQSKLGEWYKDGEITRSQTESGLTKYAKVTGDDLYWLMDKWDYEKANPKGKYGKYNKYYAAIEKGDGLTAETKRYMDHGVDKDTMSRQITSQYKPQYVELVKAGKTTQAAELKARILRAYEVLGYDRNKKIKDIDKWLKDQ